MPLIPQTKAKQNPAVQWIEDCNNGKITPKELQEKCNTWLTTRGKMVVTNDDLEKIFD
mgnify:CR=1 FL=1|jgi:hypothetical protein